MTEMKAGGRSQHQARSNFRRGELLPDIALYSTDGQQVRLSKYRGRMNLVLILAGRVDDQNVLQLLDKIAGRYPEFLGEEAEVILILLNDCASQEPPKGGRKGWPFVVLGDTEGQAHRSFSALDRGERVSPAIFVADRYGEIFAEYRAKGRELPKIDDLLQWLFFINSQCPECGVPEWPQ
jgi:peroxiredoxin